MAALLTLNQNSIVEDRNAIIDIMLTRYYVSMHSQSNIFLKSVKSLPYVVLTSGRDGGVDKAVLETKIKDDVEFLLRPYFDTVETVVAILDSTTNLGRVDIYLIFTGIYQNQKYTADKTWELKDSKLLKLSKLQ
jgi:hypothetical protein